MVNLDELPITEHKQIQNYKASQYALSLEFNPV